MIDLYIAQTNQLLGSVTDADLQVLIDKLEEESSEDRDYYIPFIEMSQELQGTLDYESKLDRSPENIGALIADGEKQARVFLKERG